MPYTEAQKLAIYRYRAKNKEKINDQAKLQYQKTKQNEDQMNSRREYAKRYYHDKKALEELISWEKLKEACRKGEF